MSHIDVDARLRDYLAGTTGPAATPAAEPDPLPAPAADAAAGTDVQAARRSVRAGSRPRPRT